jgi:hypothetical protein
MKATEKDCPEEVIKHVRSVDLTDDENASLFAWIAGKAPLDCQVHCVTEVADRIDATSHPEVIADFCSAAATYARLLEPESVVKVKAAYLRFNYDKNIHSNYFLGLRYNRIDLRNELSGKIEPDWSFTNPRKDAETWHYYLYLASLDAPGAYEALNKKIAGTISGNDVTNLLKSLADLKTEGARKILLNYKGDKRTSDTAVGPGPPISETVSGILNSNYKDPPPPAR